MKILHIIREDSSNDRIEQFVSDIKQNCSKAIKLLARDKMLMKVMPKYSSKGLKLKQGQSKEIQDRNEEYSDVYRNKKRDYVDQEEYTTGDDNYYLDIETYLDDFRSEHHPNVPSRLISYSCYPVKGYFSIINPNRRIDNIGSLEQSNWKEKHTYIVFPSNDSKVFQANPPNNYDYVDFSKSVFYDAIARELGEFEFPADVDASEAEEDDWTDPTILDLPLRKILDVYYNTANNSLESLNYDSNISSGYNYYGKNLEVIVDGNLYLLNAHFFRTSKYFSILNPSRKFASHIDKLDVDKDIDNINFNKN